jgi:hypothetical protein
MLDTSMKPIWLHAARRAAHAVGMVCPCARAASAICLDCHDQDE